MAIPAPLHAEIISSAFCLAYQTRVNIQKPASGLSLCNVLNASCHVNFYEPQDFLIFLAQVFFMEEGVLLFFLDDTDCVYTPFSFRVHILGGVDCCPWPCFILESRSSSD